MHRTVKSFLQTLKFSVGYCRYYFNHNCDLRIALCSQIKPQEFQFTKCLGNSWNNTNSPGHTVPRRSFSCKDLLKSEQENWKVASARYMDTAERIKKKLKVMYNKYTFSMSSPAIRFGDCVYFEENGCIFRSKSDADEGSVEVLLSTEDLGFHDAIIQRIRISPDQKYMATSIKSSNSEESSCIVTKFEKLPMVEYIIPNVFSFEWATNDVLFYTSQKNLVCHKVLLATFTNRKYAELVYVEQDPRFFVDIYCTKDRRFLTINSNSKTSSEVWLVDCSNPFNSPILMQQRTKGVIYHVEHRNDELYILTTYGEPAEYKLMKTPVGSYGMENWQLVYTLKEKTKLIDLEMFRDHCVMFLKHYGHLYLNVISLVSHSVQSIKLPAWACAFESEPHPEYNASTCYFQLTSPVQPPKRFAYKLVENHLVEQEAPITINCHIVRLEAKSQDEILVPITVFYNANSKELHRKPLLVHVYGAYGIDLNMSFKAEKLMLIEDGWILAYCHVRGGGELGLSWHKDGCMHNKLKGLHDLKACIMLLHGLGFSQPKYTALTGSSAGGVLAGALCNADPDLIRAVVLQAPFVDVLNTMLDTDLPLTIEEQEEWGNPLADEKYMEYIKSYCPYHNIKPQAYPSVLITAYENDQRIPLIGLLRYVHKLRRAERDHARSMNKKGNLIPNIILNVQAGGSHCAPLWEDSLNEVTSHLAFLYKEFGLERE
ncbi:prolyl endopeptidase-like isoform X1 [Gopherus evgoodei]|uniref:Prolyl endopeptidase n=2 Tax=Gopherus evgoodei TaxID=1825980 RepID=A0A8C4Y065_9SAUR|nr:prolyl endopeptidase-like isoform X1 [Gopherus evgoodei]XP_030413535.1 prolyl endopeptidase-like isoform X1 [Gopherus evgoodei]